VPWANAAPSISAAGKVAIGILATPQTVQSRAYEVEIHKRNPSLRVVQQACPGLVEAIEAGENNQAVSAIVKNCINQLQKKVSIGDTKLNAVLLGCTHYELIADIIRQQLPPSVRLYNQPSIVAQSLAKYLERNTELAAKLEQKGEKVFLTTGDPLRTSHHSRRYFGQAITFEPVVL
jgi:glutamate racemase